MKKLRGICISLILTLLLSLPLNVALADEKSTDNYEDIPVFLNDLTLQGANARQDVFFEVAKSRKVLAGSYVDLIYKHSPLLLDNASITLLMDDVPFESVKLEKSNASNGRVSLDISNLLNTPGFHKLSFLAHMELADSICPDPNNPVNWITVQKMSKIHLNLARSYDSLNLAWYPSPFFEKGSSNPLKSIFVVPDHLSQEEFASTTKLVQFFSNQAANVLLNIPIYAESDLTDQLLRDHNVIWIGQMDHWKTRGQVIINAMSEQISGKLPDSGFIGINKSSYSDVYTNLLVIGNSAELVNAVSILTDSDLYSQLLGNISSVPTVLKQKVIKELPKVGSDYQVTFEQLGYTNSVVQGVTKGSTHITYTLPGNWDVKDGVSLNLKFKHSDSIALDKSLIAVKLNGVPVDSQHLDKSNSDTGVLDIHLDRQLLGVSRTLDIEVSFEFNNERKSVSTQCANEDVLGNWGVIDQTSTLTFASTERKNFDLQSFPYPFLLNGVWQDTTFVLPESPKEPELNIAMTLAGIIGRNAQSQGNMLIASASDPQLKEQLKDRHIIYIGTAKEMPAFMNGFSDSWVQFQGERVTSRVSNVELLSELQSRSAVIQLSKSPLNEKRSLLLLTATSADRETSISHALTNALESGRISGKLSVIDSLNQVHAFEALVEPIDPIVPKEDAYVGTITKTFFTIVFVTLLLLISATIWLMRKRW